MLAFLQILFLSSVLTEKGKMITVFPRIVSAAKIQSINYKEVNNKVSTVHLAFALLLLRCILILYQFYSVSWASLLLVFLWAGRLLLLELLSKTKSPTF